MNDTDRPSEPARNCSRCGRRVVWKDALGGDMLCNATIIVVGEERQDWGTSGPHFCPSVTRREEQK